MRILHVLDHSIPVHSGYAFRTLAILREQRALGWETEHVTSAKHELPCPPVEEVDGLRFHRTAPIRSFFERLPAGNHVAAIQGLGRRLKDLIPTLNPDVIHAHSPCLTGIAALGVARRFGLPVVYEMRASWEDAAIVHGTARPGSVRYRLSRGLETWVMRQADAVTTICEGLRRDIVSRGIPEAKVTVIPNAVDPLRFRTDGRPNAGLARRLGLEGARVVGFIGSFYAYEGVDLLLEALPRMLERLPSIRLLLVGGGYEEAALKRQAAEAGIADKVIFAGRVPHEAVQDYYNLVEVFAYPRHRTRLTETVTPLKPLEAMAQGRALVASDVGGHHELIRHGETGRLFEAGNAVALGEAVLALLEDPHGADAIRQRARRFVETERSWASSVSRYAAVYGPILNAPLYGAAH
jgi:PEP-CTERM/exosortase A-associated glycosyltransferase